jgi:hypothetical protein
LQQKTEKYNITADRQYNWDEKGFLVGQAAVTQRIMSREAFESGRITLASQDGSREFVSLLACVSAAGRALPPALIYKGSSRDIQDTWLEDWNSEEVAYFGASENGWSSDALGLHWLTTVFDPHTRKSAGRGRRLLIIDGHSSHVNMKFIEQCDRLQILVMILPPHTTHRLQPLDVALFSPLATPYTKQINSVMFKSLAFIGLTKRSFWMSFWPAWQESFTPANVASGFAKSGIWPFNPAIVIDKITIPTAPQCAQPIATPMTCRAVRRIQKTYRKAPDSLILQKILRANDKLAARHEIDQHLIQGLMEALRYEKKRRKRGKRLNLVGEEDKGPQFFNPGRVQTARDLLAAKKAEEARIEQEKAEKRIQQAVKKAQKEQEEKERAEAAAIQKAATAEARAQKAAEIQLRKEAREAARRDKAQKPRPRKVPTKATKARAPPRTSQGGDGEVAVAEEVEEAITSSTRTRAVRRPARFAQ